MCSPLDCQSVQLLPSIIFSLVDYVGLPEEPFREDVLGSRDDSTFVYSLKLCLQGLCLWGIRYFMMLGLLEPESVP